MGGFGIKWAAGVLDGLLAGKEDVLANALMHKLESMGEDLISEVIGSVGGGVAGRVQKAVATGGQSEFDRARSKFLNGFRPRPIPHAGIIKKVGGLFQSRAARVRRGGSYKPGSWQGSSWAASREDWLDRQWQHDWRSQPRDEIGRWMPGRLDHIAAQLQYRGKRAGRATLRRRKLRKMRKLATRRTLRRLTKQMRQNKTGDSI
jgi:hypothetical protein